MAICWNVKYKVSRQRYLDKLPAQVFYTDQYEVWFFLFSRCRFHKYLYSVTLQPL